jgi:hypothetical protein
VISHAVLPFRSGARCAFEGLVPAKRPHLCGAQGDGAAGGAGYAHIEEDPRRKWSTRNF